MALIAASPRACLPRRSSESTLKECNCIVTGLEEADPLERHYNVVMAHKVPSSLLPSFKGMTSLHNDFCFVKLMTNIISPFEASTSCPSLTFGMFILSFLPLSVLPAFSWTPSLDCSSKKSGFSSP